MKITNLKSSLRTFRKVHENDYSETHVEVMLDRASGKVWADEICGVNNWYNYDNPAIINLTRELNDRGMIYNHFCDDEYKIFVIAAERVAKELCKEWKN